MFLGKYDTRAIATKVLKIDKMSPTLMKIAVPFTQTLSHFCPCATLAGDISVLQLEWTCK